MFIPDYSREPKEDDIVMLKNDYKIFGGIFTRGHKFKVIEKSSNGYILKDSDNNILYNVKSSIIVISTTLDNARSEKIKNFKNE